jgi:transcription elongation factor SPT6
MKYKGKKQDTLTDYHFYDDAEPVDIGPKHKLPTRTSAYEVAKKSVVSRLANVGHLF